MNNQIQMTKPQLGLALLELPAQDRVFLEAHQYALRQLILCYGPVSPDRRLKPKLCNLTSKEDPCNEF